MSLPEPQTRPTLPVAAKVVVGALAVIGLVTVVRWVLSGVVTVLLLAVVAALLYFGAKALLSRRLPPA
jgi:hypothetical protein